MVSITVNGVNCVGCGLGWGTAERWLRGYREIGPTSIEIEIDSGRRMDMNPRLRLRLRLKLEMELVLVLMRCSLRTYVFGIHSSCPWIV